MHCLGRWQLPGLWDDGDGWADQDRRLEVDLYWAIMLIAKVSLLREPMLRLLNGTEASFAIAKSDVTEQLLLWGLLLTTTTTTTTCSIAYFLLVILENLWHVRGPFLAEHAVVELVGLEMLEYLGNAASQYLSPFSATIAETTSTASGSDPSHQPHSLAEAVSEGALLEQRFAALGVHWITNQVYVAVCWCTDTRILSWVDAGGKPIEGQVGVKYT
ncbi:hypothetical protein N7453_007114 [Penicillium expansum]|nr:hypothetical protein N7453_007114 [Penicillium expansum]